MWRWVAATGVWLLAVAVVAGVAWFAVDSAGHEVGADGVVGLVAASAPATPVAGPLSATPSASPSVSPSGSPLPTHATTARDVRPAPSPSRATPSRSTSRPAGTTSGEPRPSWPGAGGTATGTGAFSSAGGSLVVRCSGVKLSGWGLRPADGWGADARLVGPGALDVRFTPGEGSVLQVSVSCSGGAPAFSPGGRSARR